MGERECVRVGVKKKESATGRVSGREYERKRKTEIESVRERGRKRVCNGGFDEKGVRERGTECVREGVRLQRRGRECVREFAKERV